MIEITYFVHGTTTDNEKEIATGSISSSGQIEILSGLKDGDIVILP